jgi:hypothetical protein
MTALASYLRHLIVVLVVLAVEKLGLPTDGVHEFASEIAAVVVATATWAVVKYVIPWLKHRGIVSMLLLIVSLSVLSTSCGSLSITEDGCILGSYQREGISYKAGPCVDSNGKVDRVRVQWENKEGQQIRATIYRKSKGTLIEYKIGEDLWIRWTAKSGVVIGPVPPEVAQSTAPQAATVVPSK